MFLWFMSYLYICTSCTIFIIIIIIILDDILRKLRTTSSIKCTAESSTPRSPRTADTTASVKAQLRSIKFYNHSPFGTVFIPIFNYKNKNWLQFLFIVKAAVLKQQISKLYPQIQRTEDSDHIYFSQRPFINVKAIFCA